LVRGLLRRFPHAARAAALVILALVLAAISNAANPLGIGWLPLRDGRACPELVERVGIPRAFASRLPEIPAKDALALLQSQKVIVVDARDEKDFDKDHLPRAVNIPMRKWADVWPRWGPRLPRDAPFLIYCYGGACGLATRMSKRLLELGYQRPIVLHRGWAAWTEAHYPTAKHPKGRSQGRVGQVRDLPDQTQGQAT
jgi:rhodanese-related sulfurtransferase